MLRPPRFPILPAALFLIAAACIYPLLAFAVENLLMLWPVALALGHLVLFVVVFAWCAHSIERWFQARDLLRFHTRRLNPVAFHIEP